MLSVCKLNSKELKNHSLKIESDYNSSDFVLPITSDEIFSHLKVWQDDSFMVLKYNGEEVDSLREELKYINFPNRCYGGVVILRTNDNSCIDDMTKALEMFNDFVRSENWWPILGWIKDENATDMEIQLITKVYDKADLDNKAVFNSLWEAVFDELETKEDKSFCEAAKKLKWSINNEVLELDMQGMTRSRFIMSLKKNEIEKRIYEYTGRQLSLKILNGDI